MWWRVTFFIRLSSLRWRRSSVLPQWRSVSIQRHRAGIRSHTTLDIVTTTSQHALHLRSTMEHFQIQNDAKMLAGCCELRGKKLLVPKRLLKCVRKLHGADNKRIKFNYCQTCSCERWTTQNAILPEEAARPNIPRLRNTKWFIQRESFNFNPPIWELTYLDVDKNVNLIGA